MATHPWCADAVYLRDEGGLAEGGTYEVYDCPVHGRHYVELPD